MELRKFYNELDILFQNKEVKKTVDYLEDCLQKVEKENDLAGMAAVCSELGSLCRVLGDLKRAKELYQQVFSSLKEMGRADTEHYATALINLGSVYVAAQEIDKAAMSFLEAKQILTRCGLDDDYRMAALCNNLSMAYRKMDQLELAENSLKKAFQIIECLPQCRAELATTFVNLGELQLRMNKLQEAEDSFLSAIRIFEQETEGQDVHYSSACSGLGELFYLKGDLKAAELYYEKTLHLIMRDFGKTPSYDLIAGNLRKIKDEREKKRKT